MLRGLIVGVGGFERCVGGEAGWDDWADRWVCGNLGTVCDASGCSVC